MTNRKALLVGASGLVGGFCLQELLKEERYGGVTALVRRPLQVSNPKLRQEVVDFSRPESFARTLEADDVFSCLGTTAAKTASREDYRRIDYGIPFCVARLAVESGAKRFLLVSSAGADARSRLFYSRIKGELDEAVSRLPFQAVHIFRPSFLLGERPESRPAEKLFLRLAALTTLVLHGPLRKYRAIPAASVAKAMVRAALGGGGVAIHEFDAILALGL
ncbi:MAG: NAD(P)H-binding protein [Elusimicrobia bacterium]|nr:NAD(P)H-binding protein [Elusimicrobiota bacterium]